MKYKYLSKHQRPFGSQIVRFTKAGVAIEVLWNSRRSTVCNILKLNKDTCINRQTGEIIEIRHTENRADNLSSVKKSLRHGRDLLNANCTDASRCLWVNLTYADNMSDPKQLYVDVKAFIREMRRRYGSLEYIVAVEPQGRGAWHCHLVMIFPSKAPYIPYSDLTEIWGHGHTFIKRIKNITNIGRYLTSYLADMDLNEAVALASSCMDKLQNLSVREVETEQNGETIKKSIVKGARLCLYPTQFHIFRWSRGIIKPTVEYITANEAEKRVENASLIYETTFQLSDDETGFVSTMNRREYNASQNYA
ncbi:MAG: hypothetical protein LBM60_02130 [Clostridium sp.]|nr:hypothetical protein [Clostridium sp.]